MTRELSYKAHQKAVETVGLGAGSRLLFGVLLVVLFAGARLHSQPGQSRFETEVVVFGFHGFEPTRITRRPGPFLLALHNGTRLRSLEFSLQDDKGKVVVGGVKLGEAASPHYRNTLNLGVGTYTLRIKELPSYTMTVVISPTGN